jgi:hypothetical protein
MPEQLMLAMRTPRSGSSRYVAHGGDMFCSTETSGALPLGAIDELDDAVDSRNPRIPAIAQLKDELGISHRISSKAGGGDSACFDVSLYALEQFHGTTFRISKI